MIYVLTLGWGRLWRATMARKRLSSSVFVISGGLWAARRSLAVLGFMHRPLEVLEAQDVREVQQGSCQGRDRYAFVDGDLIAAEPAGPVDAQALAADPSGPWTEP